MNLIILGIRTTVIRRRSVLRLATNGMILAIPNVLESAQAVPLLSLHLLVDEVETVEGAGEDSEDCEEDVDEAG